MKKKILALTLCFTIIMSTFNLHSNRSYAFDINNTSISPTMFATISSLAVGYGLQFKDDNNLYDFARDFVSWCGDTYNDVVKTFEENVVLTSMGVVSVGSAFLNYFDSFIESNKDRLPVSTDYKFDYDYVLKYGIPCYSNPEWYFSDNGISVSTVKTFDGLVHDTENKAFYINDVFSRGYSGYFFTDWYLKGFYIAENYRLIAVFDGTSQGGWVYHHALGVINKMGMELNPVTYPNTFNGVYDNKDVLDNKKEDGSVGVLIPPNVSDLVGVNGGTIYDGTNANGFGGTVSLPNVSNPSINVDGSTTFPLGGTVDTPINPPSDIPSDIPNEGLFASIKDFVISLVVPSDTFWTDTFNGFRDNFSKNFPMLDMSKFDSLAVGGKPFPNLYAYGSKIVDGDVINSIVDWLRPIIAGFIMICLMFFNYRKIYKLIRNTEPFGGIAQGSSDFRTGLSAPPINNGLDPNPMGNLRDTLFDMRNEILRRENSK